MNWPITTGGTSTEESFVESGFNWYTPGDFDGSLFLTESRKEVDTKSGAKIYPKDSILIVSIGATLGKVSISRESFSANQQINIIYPSRLYLALYVAHFLSASIASIKASANASTIGIMNQSKTGQILICFPPLSEQEAIADYLDTKTAQIDRKIDLLTQKVTRYEELKRAIVNETVTRGLDKSVPMKDSAIEWIGEIPEHWEVERINDIAIQQKIKNIGLKEKNLLSLSYGKIKRRDFDTSFGLLPESFETYQIIEAGNIILRLTDLQNDQRSLRVGLVPEKGIITSAYLCLKFVKQIHPNFAYYLLHSYDLSKVFYWFGGGLRQSMKFDDIKVFPFTFPQYSEQKDIAAYLDTKTAQIDQIIQTINTQVEKLQELRKTLINDVVTGKIKVIDN